jgi:OmcA/MtrC family decaheme c-type cytochrome
MVNDKQTMYLAIIAIIIATIGIGLSYYKMAGPEGPAGPVGPEGPAGPAGPPGPVAIPTAEPESCEICHKDAGATHQASYDQLYQADVIVITDLAYEYTAPNTHTVTFDITKDDEPVDANDLESVGIYFVPYTGTAFQFEPAAERLALKGTMTYDGAGGMTSTLTSSDPAYASDFDEVDGLVVVYGRNNTVGRLPARVYQTKYPFAALLETGDGVDYVSPANNDGCEKCHTVPYLKHSYILGQVNDDPSTDFLTCKVCHLDNGEGGHFEWQLLVDDPVKAVEWLGSDEDTSIFTAEQLEQLAYTTSVMNDVHMSHAMEFPYPQSMANCIVCHEEKLDLILTEDNFNVETCKSCHPVTGSEEYGTAELALKTILPPAVHGEMDLDTIDCAGCHGEGSSFGEFSDIHPGYDTMIYASEDLRYSDAIVVTIDDASVADNVVTIQFSATEATDLAGLDVEDIVPTVLVGMYGWDTKDFIQGPHERSFDTNGDGVIDRSDGRDLEYVVGEEHPRYTTVSAAGGAWTVTADLSAWADLIADDVVRRLEIAVIPTLEDADGVVIALDAPSRTFDLATNEFDDDFYDPIVKLEGCENCHDALATNYHSPDRGGNVVVCRLCHITKSGGSHLEMQSRSIDSYVHAIHSMQPFDVGDVNFSDPVEALHYEHHIGFPYPTHGITDCESCHIEGTNDVPDQAKSLPGLLSASDSPLEGWDRDIGEVPEYVTGPASRACGSCHKVALINEDEASELVSFNQHTNQGGYLIEAGEDALATLESVIDDIMTYYK